MDFLPATDVWKFPRRQGEERWKEERRLEGSRQMERESRCLKQAWSLFSLFSFVLLDLVLFMRHIGRWGADSSPAI